MDPKPPLEGLGRQDAKRVIRSVAQGSVIESKLAGAAVAYARLREQRASAALQRLTTRTQVMAGGLAAIALLAFVVAIFRGDSRWWEMLILGILGISPLVMRTYWSRSKAAAVRSRELNDRTE